MYLRKKKITGISEHHDLSPSKWIVSSGKVILLTGRCQRDSLGKQQIVQYSTNLFLYLCTMSSGTALWGVTKNDETSGENKKGYASESVCYISPATA